MRLNLGVVNEQPRSPPGPARLAKASIRNYSRPSPVARRRVIVSASPATTPTQVHQVSVRSLAEVPGVLASATVRAISHCDFVVIDWESFHQVLAAHPEIVDRMGGLLAARQAEISLVRAAETPQVVAERSRRLISQIREFFKLV